MYIKGDKVVVKISKLTNKQTETKLIKSLLNK